MHATEMKTKRHYTAPVTQRATVELEGGFCGSFIDTEGATNVTSSSQDFESFESSTNWGDDGKQNTNDAILWD